ncbi:MAG: hypothetical protein ACFCU3_10225 [Verrucomicrobiales bacterium]
MRPDPQKLREALPLTLTANRPWYLAEAPLALPEKTIQTLERLGHVLWKFQSACNLLYRRSVKGSAPPWIHELLDRGKPSWLVEAGRKLELIGELPVVIRPDLLITEHGLRLTEIDNLPGGIGLTAALAHAYDGPDQPVLGGGLGMAKGFAEVAGGRDVLVSVEAEDYRPEMEWLLALLKSEGLNSVGEVRSAEDGPRGVAIYRFFELFDHAAIPEARTMIESDLQMTPPAKAFLEEKLWLALFWSRPLREYWVRELGSAYDRLLREIIPFSWSLDPEPIPHQAVYPRVDVHSWEELGQFSQKERSYVIKISGFSEQAWGSRGVLIGPDVSQQAWREGLQNALADFDRGQPWILQEYFEPSLVEAGYWDEAESAWRRRMNRVRLCPYYFAAESGVQLGGVLATLVPADKKFVHGMDSAILAPVMEEKA